MERHRGGREFRAGVQLGDVREKNEWDMVSSPARRTSPSFMSSSRSACPTSGRRRSSTAPRRPLWPPTRSRAAGYRTSFDDRRLQPLEGSASRKKPETLTAEQALRYSRHLLIPEVGEAGQHALLRSKVLLIGAGGLGSPAALYLAAAGVGTLGIIDSDVVDATNLQRQILHSTERIGMPKVESARQTLEALNPDVKIVGYEERLTSGTSTVIATTTSSWTAPTPPTRSCSTTRR